MTTKRKITKTDREEACAALRKILKPGDHVHVLVTHVASSGMSRRIKCFIPVTRIDTVPVRTPDGLGYARLGDSDDIVYRKKKRLDIRDISRLVALATGHRFHDKDYAVVMGGCGMDMGFALVYDLGASLWPKGTRKPHGFRNREPDRDGGYALKHSWL